MSLLKCLELLKEEDFDVGVMDKLRNPEQQSPLHITAKAGEEELVEVLMDISTDINVVCKRGKTALSYACEYGHAAIASSLFQRGGLIRPGDFVLHEASFLGRAEVVQVLIKSGACLTSVNGKNLTPARACCVELPASVTVEDKEKCKQGRADALKLILDGGGDMMELKEGKALMHDAAARDMDLCIKVLLDRGMDPHLLTDKQGYSYTCIHAAGFTGSVNALRTLASAGADLDVCNSYGGTPLFDAIIGGQHAFADAIIELGASVTIKDESGLTPLHMACACGQMKCAYLLVENGADINAATDDGLTPLMACLKPMLCSSIPSRVYHGSKADRARLLRFLLEMGAEVDAKVLTYATESAMNDIIAESMMRFRLTHKGKSSASNLLTMAIEHSDKVIGVRLVDRVSDEIDDKVYRLNTRLVHHLTSVREKELVGSSISSKAAPTAVASLIQPPLSPVTSPPLPSSSILLPALSISPTSSASSSGRLEGEDVSVIIKLLEPEKFGFKEQQQQLEGSDTSSSSGLKEVMLTYEGTDFTKEGFAVAVEYLTTGGVTDTLVGKGYGPGGKVVEKGEGESGGGGDGGGTKNRSRRRCLFDGDGAAAALQAARYFCLDGMVVEVKRLMDIYGFELGDEESATPDRVSNETAVRESCSKV